MWDIQADINNLGTLRGNDPISMNYLESVCMAFLYIYLSLQVIHKHCANLTVVVLLQEAQLPQLPLPSLNEERTESSGSRLRRKAQITQLPMLSLNEEELNSIVVVPFSESTTTPTTSRISPLNEERTEFDGSCSHK